MIDLLHPAVHSPRHW